MSKEQCDSPQPHLKMQLRKSASSHRTATYQDMSGGVKTATYSIACALVIFCHFVTWQEMLAE